MQAIYHSLVYEVTARHYGSPDQFKQMQQAQQSSGYLDEHLCVFLPRKTSLMRAVWFGTVQV